MTKIRLAGAGMALALGAAVAPASALATPSNVQVGNTTASALNPFTAASTGQFVTRHPKPDGGNVNFRCGSASVPSSPTSSVRSGRVPTGTGILNLAKVDLTACRWPLGAIEYTAEGTWRFVRRGGTATTGQNDAVPGYVTGIRLRASNRVCGLTVTGRARATFNEASQQLVIDEQATSDSGLTQKLNFGCGGQLKDNGAVKLEATLQLNVPNGPINISNP